MASCVLPPIRSSSPPPSPIVTFFSVPRRYVKSNMQVGEDTSQTPTGEGKPGRSLRKSTRIQVPKSAPNISPVQVTKEEEQTTPSSPRSTRKENPSIEATEDSGESADIGSPVDIKTPASAGSVASSDHSPHVCLCQPEPKIPRPRNGESQILLFTVSAAGLPRFVGGTAHFGQP